MKKFFATLGIVLVVGILVVLGLASRKPDSFQVQRSTKIKAAPDKILVALNDFHAWATWSPYEKYDPAMKRSFSGPASGVGAIYEWSGNSKAGAGRMEITDSTPSKVTLKLDFSKPFEAHNVVDFTVVPDGDATSVTWAMHGPSPFMSKVMQVFMSMDKLVGKDFETGLANLKGIEEK
jgi:hypothetical protein